MLWGEKETLRGTLRPKQNIEIQKSYSNSILYGWMGKVRLYNGKSLMLDLIRKATMK